MINLDDRINDLTTDDQNDDIILIHKDDLKDMFLHFAHEVLELAAGNADADFNVVNPGAYDEHVEVYVINSSITEVINQIE